MTIGTTQNWERDQGLMVNLLETLEGDLAQIVLPDAPDPFTVRMFAGQEELRALAREAFKELVQLQFDALIADLRVNWPSYVPLFEPKGLTDANLALKARTVSDHRAIWKREQDGATADERSVFAKLQRYLGLSGSVVSSIEACLKAGAPPSLKLAFAAGKEFIDMLGAVAGGKAEAPRPEGRPPLDLPDGVEADEAAPPSPPATQPQGLTKEQVAKIEERQKRLTERARREKRFKLRRDPKP